MVPNQIINLHICNALTTKILLIHPSQPFDHDSFVMSVWRGYVKLYAHWTNDLGGVQKTDLKKTKKLYNLRSLAPRQF